MTSQVTFPAYPAHTRARVVRLLRPRAGVLGAHPRIRARALFRLRLSPCRDLPGVIPAHTRARVVSTSGAPK